LADEMMKEVKYLWPYHLLSWMPSLIYSILIPACVDDPPLLALSICAVSLVASFRLALRSGHWYTWLYRLFFVINTIAIGSWIILLGWDRLCKIFAGLSS
jgi:hypothetical protein